MARTYAEIHLCRRWIASCSRRPTTTTPGGYPQRTPKRLLYENIRAGGPLEVHLTTTARSRLLDGQPAPATGLVWLDAACTGTRFVCVISQDADRSVPRTVEFEEFGRYVHQTAKAARLVLDSKTGDYVEDEKPR